ncbi:MAG TPA: hypothetical protein VFV78_05105 [Vicinamibacterales bacterium]|nr:hypothetical protein [Vicinamibacterales bacterium]
MKAVIAAAVLALFSVPQAATPSDTRGINDAVVAAIFKDGKGPLSFVVRAEYRPMVKPNNGIVAKLGSVPAELFRKVEQAVATPPAPGELHAAANFPAAAHIVPGEELTMLVRGAPIGTNGYPALQEKYQTRDMLSFSRPVMTDDRLNVLVWYSHGCGSLCGSVGYVLLRRETITSPWVSTLLVVAVA